MSGGERRTGRREFLALGVGALAVAAVPSALRGRSKLVRRRIPVMGTVAEIAIPTRNERWAHVAIDAAFAELRRIDHTMSRFRSDSDVGRLNEAGGAWTPVSTDTGEVLSRAIRWAERSRGRFDPCLGGASELWDVAHRSIPPGRDRWVGYAGAELWRTLDVEGTAAGARARLDAPMARVDLGGIAKGFGVDRAVDALRGFGVTDGLVNVGGDLVALGADASGDPWVVGVRSPDDPGRMVATLRASDAAIATSGDYLRFFEHEGRRYHHLLDPVTGRPRRTATRSLTVRAPLCVDADAAATALFGAGRTGLPDRIPPEIQVVHHITEVST